MLVGDGSILAGQVMAGGVVSITVIEKAQVAGLPDVSDTRHVTSVEPRVRVRWHFFPSEHRKLYTIR